MGLVGPAMLAKVAAVMLLGGGAAVALSQAPATPLPAPAAPPVQSPTPKPDPPPVPGAGQVSGMVNDSGSDVVDDAEVALTRPSSVEVRKTKTDTDGKFRFGNVPPGKFTVTATSKGLTPGTYSGVLQPGEDFGRVTLKVGSSDVDASVSVTASQVDLAEAEVKVEEHQRIAGFMPNFFVAYDWKAAPLDTRQKFELAWRNTLDPANLAISAGSAGVQQALNSDPGYGRGAAGYGKRFASDSGDLLFGTFLGGFVYPVIFHQDPRYFYKGTGTIFSRAVYAVSRAVICRGDNGKWQPSYSGVLGDLTAGAISNFYYPAAQRSGVGLTISNGMLQIAEDGIGNLVQEFVFKHLTPHAPNYPTAGTQ